MRRQKIINLAISSQEDYCEGFFSSKDVSSYFLGINFAVAKVKKKFSHEGSSILDEINAFDLAEISSANLGQINVIKVSSFCGPKGLIWGYDVAKIILLPIKLQIQSRDIKDNINIFDIEPLVDAFKHLTGTVTKNHFPFLPGAHVPCATKFITKQGKCILYTALGFGIPEDRDHQACCLMEDFGTLPLNNKDLMSCKNTILKNLVKSILAIGLNQNVKYTNIFIGLKDINVNENEIGCALVSAPYFSLAKNAYPKNKDLNNISFNEWTESVSNHFLYKKIRLL